MGAAKYLGAQFGIQYETALFLFSIIIALYVIMGGLKGVMYTDALQATIMLVGMVVLVVLTYWRMGGITAAHQQLTDLGNMVPAPLQAAGHQGWTSMPAFGSPYWWTLVSTIVLGVGIGVLAQPQLAVRYMTVKSRRELNRAIPIGGVFILMMTGVAFVVGALSNVYFVQETGKIALIAADKDVEQIIPNYIKGAMPDWFGMLFMLTLLAAAMSTLSSQFHAMGTSLGRDIYEQAFKRKGKGAGFNATRIGVLIGIIISVYLGYLLEEKYGRTGTAIVARGTALFFGLCASSFLPMYIGALWSKAVTKAGAISGMLTGGIVSILWMLFVHQKESDAFLLCKKLFGVSSLGMEIVNGAEVPIVTGPFIWAFVDPLIIGLPLALIVTFAVSLWTKPFAQKHLGLCFGEAANEAAAD
jgi:SSS family solute:Na+ symporter